MQHYIYDAAGERVLKAGSIIEHVYGNGTLIDPGSVTFDLYKTYPNPFVVIEASGQYSKHYYAGAERVVSRIGDGDPRQFVLYGYAREGDLKAAQKRDLQQYADQANVGTVAFQPYEPDDDWGGSDDDNNNDNTNENSTSEANANTQNRAPEPGNLYFFHPDHLGTATFLSDINGEGYQFFLNLPFGETMAEQHSFTEDYANPFKFNGKELDEETGMYYYGARYYDPKISIWMSVDPLAEKYHDVGPYVYVANNPINAIDPDGRKIIFLIRDSKGAITRKLEYRNGNFWHSNGKRYNPGKERLSVTMYQVLTAYRKIESSNDKKLKNSYIH